MKAPNPGASTSAWGNSSRSRRVSEERRNSNSPSNNGASLLIARNRGRIAALIVAVAAAFAFVLLGRLVSGQPPSELDRAIEAALAGRATGPALIFTRSCYWYVLVPLGAALIALAFLSAEWRARAIFAIAITLIGWRTSDFLKPVFARPRPPQWYAIHETSFGYPSGHAMFAIVIYALWTYFILTSTLPAVTRRLVAAALALWAGGVCWSRLALGAHYPTDLAGGALLGVALLATGFAIAPVVQQKSVR